MDSVGIRHLKAHLSACLKRVSAGEQIAVTDRGRLVAYLVPAEAAPDVAWVHSMMAMGRAQWDGGRPAGLSPRLPSRGKPASRTVLDDRR